MKPVEKLYFALGEIAYAMVWSNNRIRYEEIARFMETVTTDLNPDTRELDLLGTMFRSITGDKKDAATAYMEAIAEIRENADYLYPELRESFVRVLERVESAYAPFTMVYDKKSYVDRFKEDVSTIKGSRVYMGAIFLN